MTDRSSDGAEQLPLERLPESDRAAAFGAMLFVATEPVPLTTLAQQAGCDREEARAALAELEARLAGIGLRLAWPAPETVELVTEPWLAHLLQRFLGLERTVRLSQAALETVAIVAYLQPVTRAEIERIRGVDSSGVLQTLIARELVEPVGRLEAVGSPMQYGTTPRLLRYLGLSRLDELPPIPDDLATFMARREGDEGACGEPSR